MHSARGTLMMTRLQRERAGARCDDAHAPPCAAITDYRPRGATSSATSGAGRSARRNACVAFAICISLGGPAIARAQYAPAAAAARAAETDEQLCEHAAAPHTEAGAAGSRSRARAEIAADSASLRATFLRGCVLFGEQNPDAAADMFASVVAADDRTPYFHFWLARAYAEQARRSHVFRQALLVRRAKADDRAVALDPDYLDAHQGLMRYYLLAPRLLGGGVDKAREQVQEIARRNAYQGALAQADVALHERDTTTATNVYHDMIEQYPDSAAPFMRMAAIYIASGRAEDATHLAQSWVAARPENMVASYLTGRVASESGQDLDRGQRALLRYVSHSPARGEPSVADASCLLGAIYERRGFPDSARTAYESALALDPALSDATRALARLK